MKLKIGPLEVNVLQPSGWVYDTSAGLDVMGGLFKVISAGAGFGRLVFKQKRAGLPNTGRSYSLEYAQVVVGVGTPWPIPVTASGSAEAFTSASVGGLPVFRMPGSPDASGEGGPPTGFRGTFSMSTISGNVFAGGTAAIILMGAIEFLTQPVAYKYFTIVSGASVSSAIGAGVTGARGYLGNIQER